MSEFGNKWVTKDEAAKAIGKSTRTVARWCHDNPSHVKPNGTLNLEELGKTHRIVSSNDDKRLKLEIEAGDKMNTQVALQSARESIDILHRQIETKDKQIEKLIENRGGIPAWMRICYLFAFGGVLYGLWLAFGYAMTQIVQRT